jgi:DNA-binding MarR family transcriptional regulator
MPEVDPLVSTLELWIDVFMRRSMQNLIHYARKSGLSMSQLGTLYHLSRMGSSGVSDIGDHLGVTSAAASMMLDRLVQQDLIERSEDPRDRRVKQVVLTGRGRRVLEESTRTRKAWLNDLAKTLSDPEKATITEALDLLVERVNQFEQPV